MVRPIASSKSVAIKDHHLSKNWPGSSAGPNKNKLTGEDELDYEEMAVEDARRDMEEARREDAKDAPSSGPSTSTMSQGDSSSSIETNSSSDTSSTREE
ncbi:unnamed protein product [Tilletia controversa]|uniref:Uncharacterized protein n=3 Tax=Tilletia TaxID=13289 RepID=A0A8X7MXN6_9BASI|nr:hypothetical protein CF336_g1884 [Tilletia laevis]KAE8203082.1 hypothetical protein CF328_g1844 [Tilletia controversa]KAE8263827.1 hypothetical protein A4X03_0g1390 [Tilletia caries]KAE8206468.1 hypothetical protein CF335_g1863 [Tilletia laevis]KAE8252230.1 hypothetical protein A4X06_0g2337 [Tilletia controversa]